MKWWKCRECGLMFRGQKDKQTHIQFHINRLALKCIELNKEIDAVHEAIHRWRQR